TAGAAWFRSRRRRGDRPGRRRTESWRGAAYPGARAKSQQLGRRQIGRPRERRDRGYELAGIDGFREVHLKSVPQRPEAIVRSRVRGERDRGQTANGRIR